jgi:hypothetical protein
LIVTLAKKTLKPEEKNVKLAAEKKVKIEVNIRRVDQHHQLVHQEVKVRIGVKNRKINK